MSDTDRLREAYRYCETLVRVNDKDSYIASLFAPAERRPWLFALYAFALEIARVKTVVRDPLAGMIRLQWWQEAIAGLRPEEAAANPVMLALQDASRRSNVSLASLSAAIEARQDELQATAPTQALSAIFATAARFLGAGGTSILSAADHAADALACLTSEPDAAREAYANFRADIDQLEGIGQPAFLTVALVPLLLTHPDAPPWRRQIEMLRAAWFGFPRL
ncbi:MAG TPA: squalene/phytoene synthase family protein [Pseudolabrys sp.]|jgi:phytoene/squalene synthetase|nr:squalene/phytoene synthase family protein [Pseudolabrys sp.]